MTKEAEAIVERQTLVFRPLVRSVALASGDEVGLYFFMVSE